MFRILVLLVFFTTTHAWGQIAAPEVTVAQLDAAEKSVSASLAADDPQRVALLKSYAETRAALASFEQFNQQFNSFALSRTNAQKDAVAIEKMLAIHHNAPEQDYKVSRSLSLPELEQRIQIDKTELDTKKSQLADISATIDAMPQRPTEIYARVSEVESLSADLKAQLGLLTKKVTSGSGDEAAVWLARAQLASFAAEKSALNEELLSQAVRLELLKAQMDQASFDIAVVEKKSRAMALRATELRQGEAAQAQAAADLILAEAQGKHELIQQLAGRNAELTRTFGERSADIEGTDHQADLTRGKAEQLETDLTAIERKLELLGMSTALGGILRERQAQLPEHRETAKKIAANEEDIRESSLRQVELEDERRLLRNRADYVKQLVHGVEPEVAEQVSDDLSELVRSRRDLLRKAIELENTYAQQLGDLDFTLRKYAGAVDAYRDFISKRLLWIPSRDTFAVFRGGELVEQAREVYTPGRWLTVVQNIPAEIQAQPLTAVVLLLVLLLMYFSPRLRRQLTDTGKHVGYVRQDKFSSTLQALGLSVLLSLKWPLLLMTTAWLFEMQDEESELATALYVTAMRTALYFWGLEFLRVTLQPKGLVDRHFHWPSNRVSLLNRHIVKMELTFLPATAMVVFFLNLYRREDGGPLGALAVVLVLLSIANFFRNLPPFIQNKVQVMFRGEQTVDSPMWARLIRRLLFWIPIVSILAVLFGYTFSAIEIALLLIKTFVMLSCALILYELGLRWLGLARRRMAFKVQQEQVKTSSEDGEASVEDEILENDPELLNDEGTKLLNLLTLFGAVLGVAWIWAEVFPALGILDSVKLWDQTALVDGKLVADPVTLADLCTALIVGVIGWVLVRRIPGLLEILLRQQVKLHAASAYAFSRVFQYVTTTLLVIFVVGALGGSWSSMQWAVAALSLGIGFGLQEIVANFISGLIVLFEQPIRVGDIVTVGEISGKVTRIQMRATTIRDFDNRELLVPNKEFITKQLLNWSLTDSVTRRLIQVGVAYGTDMDQALGLVREVAMQHPLVMREPEPLITFDEFGDSSLLISLRYLIEHLDQRLIVDSEIRLQINRRFKEVGIVVAYPRRDIHLDTSQPLEIKMVQSGPAV
jgi:potassium efflux system protein